ncbi:MAG: ABC transporter ATP-binding protein [Acidimicrobiales bacterium]
MSMLRTDSLSVSFGGVQALAEVHLTVEPGGITGLIGPNGAGKTTFIDAVTGMVPTTGSVHLGDHDISRLSANERATLGLVRTFQTLELFEDLTVEDNLAAAATRIRWWEFIVDALVPRRRETSIPAVESALELLGLTEDRDRFPADLSHGHRRLVGVARALAASPKVLLLDEPAAGLDSAESLALGDRLRAIAATGVTVFLIDHDMGLVLDVCDRIHVLDFGSIIATGSPDEIRTDPAVVAAYLGRAATAT